MIQKQQIKDFFSRYKRTIMSVSLSALALVLVTTIAVSASNKNIEIKEGDVQTSAPTSIEFIMPVKGGEIIKDYSATSLKYNETLKQWEAHKGLDIKGTDGADILCAYDGEVVSIETNYLNGTVVKIRHSNELETIYSSCAENVCVKVGDKLKTGDKIGEISSSAKNESAEGDHLHFEVLENGKKVDPNLYLESSNK